MGQAIAGPIVGTFLGDLGADVIKIERLTEDVWRGQCCRLYGESFPPSSYTTAKNITLCGCSYRRRTHSHSRWSERADAFVQNWPPGFERLNKAPLGRGIYSNRDRFRCLSNKRLKSVSPLFVYIGRGPRLHAITLSFVRLFTWNRIHSQALSQEPGGRGVSWFDSEFQTPII
jgi:hypothetical protein